jgi:hypothetical protein
VAVVGGGGEGLAAPGEENVHRLVLAWLGLACAGSGGALSSAFGSSFFVASAFSPTLCNGALFYMGEKGRRLEIPPRVIMTL